MKLQRLFATKARLALTATVIALTVSTANSAIAVPAERINQWFATAQNAVKNNDYDTAIINFRRIINNTSDGCDIVYYARWLKAAQVAKDVIKKGGSPSVAIELYATHARVIESNPNLGCH